MTHQHTSTLANLIAAIETLAPTHLASDWDNTGLILGSPDWPAQGPLLLTLDATPAVCEEALAHNVSLLLTYHPPIFHPIKSLNTSTPQHAALLALIRAGVGIYSPHTALDAAPEGMCDWLLDQCLDSKPHTNRRALEPHTHLPATQELKLIVFCPPESLDAVRTALANAGAGIIDNYTHCAFTTEGVGAFLPGDNTNPTVGSPGTLEHTAETKLEMVCNTRDLPNIIAALKHAHPYEEPAFDVFAREAIPISNPNSHTHTAIGHGRIATLDTPTHTPALARTLAKNLGISMTKVVDARKPIRSIACCPGAGSSLIDDAIAAGADAFITGEASHHTLLSAREQGLSIILAGHANTERPYLPTLARKLAALLPGHKCIVSTKDTGPVEIV